MSKKQLVIDILNVKVTRLCSTTNVLLKYDLYLNLTHNEAAMDLELQSIKKYKRRTVQIADKFSHL